MVCERYLSVAVQRATAIRILKLGRICDRLGDLDARIRLGRRFAGSTCGRDGATVAGLAVVAYDQRLGTPWLLNSEGEYRSVNFG